MAGPIRISILANASQANQALQQTASRTQRLGGAFRSMAAPAAALAGGIAVVGKASLDAASDAQQSLGATQTVFGKYADTVIKRSEEAATALGLSANEYRELSNVTGALLGGAGVPLNKLAGLTDDLNKRAADMAATFGGTTREAVEAISSLLKGEADPIEKYGVSIKESDVQARLAAKGLDKLTGAGLKQASMQARLELLTSKTSKLQGAFARESDTYANAQQKAAAQAENLKAKLGTALLPVFTRVVKVGSQLVDFFSRNTAVAKGLAVGLGVLAVSVLAVNAAMALNPAVLVAAALAALAAAAVVAYQKSETFRNIIDAIGRAFTQNVLPALRAFGAFVVAEVVPRVVQIAQAVGARLKPILDQLGVTFRTQVIPAAQQAANKFREWLPTIKRVISAVISVYGKLATFYATVLGKVIPIVIRVVATFYGKLIPAIVSAIGTIARIITKAVDIGVAFVNAGRKVAEFATKVGSKIGDALRDIGGLPGKAVDAIGDVGRLLFDAGASIIQGLIDGITSKIGALTSKLGDLTKLIPGKKGPPAKDRVLLKPAGRLIMDGLIAGLEDGTPRLERALRDITQTISRTDLGELRAGLGFDVEAGALAVASRPAPIPVAVHLSTDVLDEMQRGKRYTADIDAFTASGGRRKVS